MIRRKGTFGDYLVYLALRVAAMFLHMCAWPAVYRLAGRLGNAWFVLDRRHRDRTAEHIRLSFPDWTERKVLRVTRASFRSMAYIAVEVLLTSRLMTHYNWRKQVVLTEMGDLLGLLLKGRKGLIFIMGHFGGWEVTGYTFAALGFKGYALARPLDNPYLNEYLLGAREKMGLKILDKVGATEQVGDILRAGSYVGFFVDQDYGRKGVFVDFFGRKASTYKTPALMAMENDAPVVVGYGRRVNEQYFFEMGVERIIQPHEWAGKDDPLKWITQEYTTALENVIRKAPEQYLWIYRRWKTRPPDETNRHEEAQPQPASRN